MTKGQFRVLLLLTLLMGVAGLIPDFVFPIDTTEQIQEYAYELESENNDDISTKLIIYMSFVLVLSIVDFVGLMLFKFWAKPLYLITWLLLVPMYFIHGTSVSSGLSQLIYDSELILSGIIIGVLYFSPVSGFFEREQ